jgi:hypothetical protein
MTYSRSGLLWLATILTIMRTVVMYDARRIMKGYDLWYRFV